MHLMAPEPSRTLGHEIVENLAGTDLGMAIVEEHYLGSPRSVFDSSVVDTCLWVIERIERHWSID